MFQSTSTHIMPDSADKIIPNASGSAELKGDAAVKLSNPALAPTLPLLQIAPPSPIAQLPTEIMVDIFVLAVRTSPREHHKDCYATLQTLYVCSGWRNIILHSPRLWSFICNRHK